jgi:hypothetical protein
MKEIIDAIEELHKHIKKEDTHLDMPKAKDMDFPMHGGEQLIENMVKCDWCDKLLMERAKKNIEKIK